MNQILKSMSPLQTVRGMHDFLPGQTDQLAWLENQARNMFTRFGYYEIRTPVVEFLALFERALGQTTDIVEKEMFVIKGDEEQLMCLRPEGTASVVRSLIEHSLDKQSSILKLFYLGPMFRAERPQAGRYRQFLQIGSEYFGNPAPAADAETIQLTFEILRSLGIPDIEIQMNSLGCAECRPKYQERLLNFLNQHIDRLCKDCQKRIKKNPFRALDCKIDSEHLQNAPKSLDSLCTQCLQHHQQLIELLQSAKTPFKIASGLVRGLDYYTRTVFEVYASGKTGSQDALAAGGRYDTLVQELGGNAIPAVGFALGVERVLSFLNQIKPAEETKKKNGVFVAALGYNAILKSFQIVNDLRQNGLTADAVLNNQSLKSQMRLADSLGMRFCAIIGDNELKDNSVALRDMQNQSQKNVPFGELITVLKRELNEL